MFKAHHIAMILGMMSCNSFSQDKNDESKTHNKQEENRLEQVTVIGHESTKAAQLAGVRLTELPLSVFVVSREELERIRFTDPDDFLDRIPGETQVRNLRIPQGGKPYTLPLVDGIPLENPYDGATSDINRVNNFDIERIEIIKGPASALYANNAFGGVINVVTRGIPEKQENRIFIEGGDFGSLRTGINSGGALSDTLGYFVDANILESDGLRDNFLGDNPNNFPDAVKNDRKAISAKLLYQPYENTEFAIRYEYLNRDEVTATDTPQDSFDLDPTLILSNRDGNPDVSFEEADSEAVYLKAEHTYSSGTINFSGVIRDVETQGDGRFSPPQISDDDSISSKLWYKHDLNDSNIIVGTEIFRGETHVDEFDAADLNFVNPSIAQSDTDLDITALFAQYMFKLSEVLEVTLGARYEEITTEVFVEDSPLGKESFDDISPKFGLSYQVNATNMLWFGISEGFLAPDPDDLFDTDAGNTALKPEEATNIEFGIRGSAGKWSYNSSYYHTEIENFIFTQEIDDETEQTSNAAQVTAQGLESVIEYIPTQDWRFGLTHTYSRNTFDSFVQSTPGADDDFSGNSLSRTPDHHLNARIAWLPLEGLIVELESDFYTSYTTSDAEDDPLGEFKRGERIDLRINYKINQWNFWLNGLNLTDTLEDRVSYSTRNDVRSFRLVHGRTYQAGISLTF